MYTYPDYQTNQGQMWNYDTETFDHRVLPFATIEDALPYLPKEPTTAARSAFRIYVEDMGLSIPEAYIKVMTQIAGITTDAN